MGGAQAAKVLQQIEMASMKKKGVEPDEAEQAELFKRISSRYETQTSPVYAAARLWVDAIIDPNETRNWISTGIQIANRSPAAETFNLGVIQT